MRSSHTKLDGHSMAPTAALLVVFVAVVGCGSDPDVTSTSAEGAGHGFGALVGISGDLLAVAATDAGEGAAVIEGGTRTEDGLRMTVTWVVNDAAEAKRVTAPFEDPLFDVSAWWTGDEVAIVGLPCPPGKMPRIRPISPMTVWPT